MVVPASKNGCLIYGTLNIWPGVKLEGITYSIGDKYVSSMEDRNGVVFLMTGGEGTTTGQGIYMHSSSTIRNIKFFYPNQSKSNVVKLFPPTIRLVPSGGNDCP